MLSADDLTDLCLVIASSGERFETVLEVAVERGSAADGRDLRVERADPLRLESELPDDFLDLLLFGAGAVVDLSDVGPRLFRVLAWQARARPRAVVLMRHGSAAFPLDLHAFAVRSYDASTAEGAAAARREVSRLATLAASAQASSGTPDGRAVTPWARRRRLRRSRRTGVVQALRQAARRLHVGDAAGAAEALDRARADAPGDPDLALRAAVLHREAGLWSRAGAEVEALLEADPTCAVAWRELGIVRDRQGDETAAVALRRAVDLGEDYEALVALGGRERAVEQRKRLLLRAAHVGRVALSDADRRRVEGVLAIRGEQASDDPAEDGPWSHFDAAQACLLLGRSEDAARFAAGAAPFLHAPWERETFGRSVDALEAVGVDVAGVRGALGLVARGPSAAPPRVAPPPASVPFPAAAREAEGFRANVPCAAACPVGTDAGAYVTLVAHGEDAEAYRVARGPNPFASVCGRVCAAPCEDACRRG
ncbi:MAG TPA: tetratricopeptide repeat protein, partial [Planctomycetota bacterium]|nr:tetratricopeptide repeat protein [Planctomycetota bacterium]